MEKLIGPLNFRALVSFPAQRSTLLSLGTAGRDRHAQVIGVSIKSMKLFPSFSGIPIMTLIGMICRVCGDSIKKKVRE